MRRWLCARLREEKAQSRELRLQLQVAQNALDQTRAAAIAQERALNRSLSDYVKGGEPSAQR